VVVGAGRSGRAAVNLLLSRGALVTLADSGDAMEGGEALVARGVTVRFGPDYSTSMASADLIVVSPGVPWNEPSVSAARSRGIEVIGEVELASRFLKGRVIAITGTKGKSTTTTLTARMLEAGGLRATAGGNLGVALSSLVDASTDDSIHVVEVSSFQLESITMFHPWISAFINLSPDHLDRHGSFEEYGTTKSRIYANQNAIVERRNGTSRTVMPLAAVSLPGRHLLADVLAATGISLLAGVAPEAIESAVRGFNGLEHALERVATIGGVLFVNDSKATNVVSARRAIESFEGDVVPILGGRYKGGDFGELRDVLQGRASGLVAIGEAADRIESSLGGVVPVTRASSMADAVARAYGMARPGGVVVLAPACSSFDMFSDYAARGRAFRAAVAELASVAEGARSDG
jgi:UDP-N-acetylmuramoylalanine--D-glutamate ligase